MLRWLSENQNKLNPNRCHYPLITYLSLNHSRNFKCEKFIVKACRNTTLREFGRDLWPSRPKTFNLIENKIKKKLTWRLRIKPFYTSFDIFNITHVFFHGVIESVIFGHWHYALVSHKWGNVRTPSSENSWNFWNENLVSFNIIKTF